MKEPNNIKNWNDTPLVPIKLKLKNKNRLFLGQLNLNSLAGKFDQPKFLIENSIITLVLTETKNDSSFPNAQLALKYSRYLLDLIVIGLVEKSLYMYEEICL